MTFEFDSVGRIIFGCGQFAKSGELAADLLIQHDPAAPLGESPSHSSGVLVVYNGCRDGDGGASDKLAVQLDGRGLRPCLQRQHGEPAVDDVERILDAARSAGCRLVIGLGGGSAIDAAKAVAGLLTNGGQCLDYMEVVGRGQKLSRPACPWIAIPTTAGTGAEATRNAVVAYPPRKFKASLRSHLLLPAIALVDPELTVSAPPAVTAASGMDALCQLIESYTSRNANPMTDGLAIRGIALAGASLPTACRDGKDIAARTDMSMAALLSGITLTNAGLGAVHGLAAPLGANFPIPHGVVCAALLGGVVEMNLRSLGDQSPEHPAIARYAAAARAIGAAGPLDDDRSAADALGPFLRRLRSELSIPPLGSFGLGESDVASMAELASASSSIKANPVTLTTEQLQQVLRQAM